MILNRDQLWALSPAGKEKFKELILLGMEEDLAFEVLNRLYDDTEIYAIDTEELDNERPSRAAK